MIVVTSIGILTYIYYLINNKPWSIIHKRSLSWGFTPATRAANHKTLEVIFKEPKTFIRVEEYDLFPILSEVAHEHQEGALRVERAITQFFQDFSDIASSRCS